MHRLFQQAFRFDRRRKRPIWGHHRLDCRIKTGLVAGSTIGTHLSMLRAKRAVAHAWILHAGHRQQALRADSAWSQAHVTDWLEAFAAHPRIGDLDQLKAKYNQFVQLSETEQAAAASASGDVLQVPCLLRCIVSVWS